ncbi:MAG: DNA polymerase IV, partial [Chloroflexi bacterium]|nr:DNA polymerase IV [Chloroflexota bacterium]
MPQLRAILHVDMDAFFASVEMRSDPRLQGLPLAVGGGPHGRGVVTTASYPARVYGIRSGMAMVHARRLCPQLLVIPVDPARYIFESLRVLSVLERMSPLVEPASIDEAYIQIPGVAANRWSQTGKEAAERVLKDVRRRCGLPCSVGVGVNKVQAKMATPLGKPEGVSVLSPGTFLSVFGHRPVSVIPGIGDLRNVIFGGFLIVVIILFPRGIAGFVQGHSA